MECQERMSSPLTTRKRISLPSKFIVVIFLLNKVHPLSGQGPTNVLQGLLEC